MISFILMNKNNCLRFFVLVNNKTGNINLLKGLIFPQVSSPKNQKSDIICSPLYTVIVTVEHKRTFFFL